MVKLVVLSVLLLQLGIGLHLIYSSKYFNTFSGSNIAISSAFLLCASILLSHSGGLVPILSFAIFLLMAIIDFLLFENLKLRKRIYRSDDTDPPETSNYVVRR